jgi:hypothetical protein
MLIGSMYGKSLVMRIAVADYLSKVETINFSKSSDIRTNTEFKHAPKIWIVKRLIRNLASKYTKSLEEVESVSLKDLTEAIEQVKGSDPRTIRKYTHLLEAHDCIRITSNGTVDIS